MDGDSHIVIKEQDLIGTFPGSGATADDIPKLSPMGDRILIKPEKAGNTTAGGVMLTDRLWSVLHRHGLWPGRGRWARTARLRSRRLRRATM